MYQGAIQSGTYQGVFIRDGLDDTGAPYQGGVPYYSPDIIPYGTQTLSYADATSTYAQDIGQALLTGQGSVNNIYIRAKNLNSAAQTATVSLYRTTAALLNAPSVASWTPITAANGNTSIPLSVLSGGQPSTQIPSDAIALSEAAFSLDNLVPPSQYDHYCLICIVQDPSFQVTIPASFNSNADFASWVKNNSAVAWRNVTHYASSDAAIAVNYLIGNISSNPHLFAYVLSSHGGFLPTGTTVNIQCTDTQYLINATNTAQAPIQNEQAVTFFPNLTMPSGFSGGLTVTITPPSGQSIPAGTVLRLKYYQVPDFSIQSELDAAETVMIEGKAQSLVPIGAVNIVID